MICSRCKKRPAVVFVSKHEGEKVTNEGYCISCASELGIMPVNDIMKQMGITPEMAESMQDELNGILGGAENEDAPDFEEGGTQAFPFLNLFGKKDKEEKEGEPKKGKPEKDKKRKFLDAYCINLTKKAAEGKIDNIIGREKELDRTIQILCRRTKNNPCLIGEPGVGKTAVAEGIAQRIASGGVPAKLAKKELYLLDLTALVAGTQFRGQFEGRIKGLVDEVKKLGNIILVIDEVHNLVSVGDSEGAMNAANILKPALSRGEIQVIGATTFAEYRKYIEKDAALERRFQPIVIEEPSLGSAVDILNGIKKYYETYHGVDIDTETVRQAVILSERYITDRYLPDKAIDLIDEAASSLNIADKAKNALILCEDKLKEANEALEETLANDAENYEKIAGQRAEVAAYEKQRDDLQSQVKTLNLSVEDLASVIELWTGVPASKIKEDEFVKIQNLESTLKSHIIGQDHAIKAVVSAIKRNRAGISAKRKPVSFIFAGPTGVGKTELVKQLASALFDSPETLFRLDMSEFMEKHSVSRIIGAPPGYVGYDEAGQLTEKVRRKPYCVILFDEIEKAHPDVLNILLQILDDGRITDAHGKNVNFENTVIVMTTNAGSEQRSAQIGFTESAAKAAEGKTMKALEGFLRPEFINRVDEIVTFNSLSEENFIGIADIMLGELADNLALKGIEFSYTDAAKALLVKNSYSQKFGARNLRRTLEKQVENLVAELIIESGVGGVNKIKLCEENGEFKLIKE